MIDKQSSRNIIQKEKSGFPNRIDKLREEFLIASGSNDYATMIQALKQIMYEIEPIQTNKIFKKQLKLIPLIYNWYFTLEDKYTVRSEFGYKIKYPNNIKIQMEKRISIANSIIMKNLHNLGLCEY